VSTTSARGPTRRDGWSICDPACRGDPRPERVSRREGRCPPDGVVASRHFPRHVKPRVEGGEGGPDAARHRRQASPEDPSDGRRSRRARSVRRHQRPSTPSRRDRPAPRVSGPTIVPTPGSTRGELQRSSCNRLHQGALQATSSPSSDSTIYGPTPGQESRGLVLGAPVGSIESVSPDPSTRCTPFQAIIRWAPQAARAGPPLLRNQGLRAATSNRRRRSGATTGAVRLRRPSMPCTTEDPRPQAEAEVVAASSLDPPSPRPGRRYQRGTGGPRKTDRGAHQVIVVVPAAGGGAGNSRTTGRQ
jgi:hypothetical protein